MAINPAMRRAYGHGIVGVCKPVGPTSAAVVARVKKALNGARTGHGGSLDPFGTGVLVLGVGKGCSALSSFLTCRKAYRFTARLGRSTDTGDLLGKTTAEGAIPPLDRERVEAAVRALVGRQLQEPPMFSAKRIDGVRLHELARQGKIVERKAVPIEVYDATLCSITEATGDVELDVTVSKGTYIRVLAERIGSLLGAPAHAHALTRTRVGPIMLSDCLPPESLDDKMALMSALSKHTAIARGAGIKV